jgi:hypothetical protein
VVFVFQFIYLDFSPFSRSLYVIDIDASKQQRLSFPRKIVASLCTNGFSTHACKEAALSTINTIPRFVRSHFNIVIKTSLIEMRRTQF